MFKKTLLLLIVMLALPNLASAFNYWSVTATTSPSGITGAITPPSGAGYATSGNVTNITSSTITTADFTVDQTPVGYVLSYVLVDGLAATPVSPGVYRVTKGTRTTHTLSAVYSAKSFTITTSKTGNGVIDPSTTAPAGSSKTINMSAGSGYMISGVTSDGATRTGGDGINTASYTFTNIQSNKSISVTFVPVPSVMAIITTQPQSIVVGGSATIDGSASTYTVTPTFTWSVSPGGATLTPSPDGRSAVFSAATLGTWTVQLTLTGPGAVPSSASVTVSTVTQAYSDSIACTACHADRSTAIVTSYLASTHVKTATASCQGCHNPTGALQHYFNLMHTTVSQTTFKYTDPVAGPVGTVFCTLCHSSAQVAQSAAHATVNCGSCHNNDVHNPDIPGGGVNATFCGTCHGVSAAAIPPLSAAHGATVCSGCHGTVAHNPHIAGAGVNAAFCGTCHGTTAAAIPPLSTAHSSQCSACHGTSEHNPHIAGAGVNATYCGSCHGVAANANPIPPLSAAHNLACSGCHGNSEHNPHITGSGMNATFCSTCHGTTAGAIPQLSAGHSTQCSGCHGTSEHNPHTTDGVAANPCFTCHNKPNQPHYWELATAQLDGQCATCHSGHNHNPQVKNGVLPEHFNGYTSYANPAYAAAYLTPATGCASCHKEGDATSAADLAILQYRADWAASGHGDTTASPWVNSKSHNWKAVGAAGVRVSQAGAPNDCQRCHSAPGYLQFTNTSSIAPVATAAARYSEPLTCNACHNADFTPRSVTPRTGYYNYTSAPTGRLLVSARFPDSQSSNICLGCHTGREAGDTIKAMAAATAHRPYSTSFWQGVSFLNSHYLAAGGQVFGVTGYEYPGFSYANAVDHSLVGSGAGGPCVVCHMPGKTHTLAPDAAAYSQCNGCHDGALSPAFVAGRTANFEAALKALGAALAQKGYAPNVVAGKLSYPYFTNTNWGNKDTGPGTMGAAFNYNLLVHDPGAFAHNPTYAKRLVRDSLDFLVNGSVDRSRDLTGTVNALLSTPTERVDANAFLLNSANGSAACAVCHSATPDPLNGKNILVLYNASKHASRPGGASCANCHAPGDTVAHPPQMTMLKDSVQIAGKCAGCHGLPHTWPSEGVCVACHNGHDPTPNINSYPHFSSYSTAQYMAKSNSCTNCHNQGSASFRVFSANHQWAESGHGNPRSPAYVGPGPYTEANLLAYDFKLLGTAAPATAGNTVQNDCVRCHTQTGYLNYVTPSNPDDPATAFASIAPWGSTADRTREMVGCPVCHVQTAGNQLASDFGRRLVGIVDEADSGTTVVKGWFHYSSPATGKITRSKLYVDADAEELYDSNLCITCHSGKVVGDLIKPASNSCAPADPSIACRVGRDASGKQNAAIGAINTTFWANVDFVDPHGGQAANLLIPGSLHGAYEYWPGTAITPDHASIGSGIDYLRFALKTQGPCVGCHMTSPEKHTFKAISSSGGVIKKITSTMCVNCHDGEATSELTAAGLQQSRKNYRDALAVIKSLLAVKGINYNPAKAPYFFTTDDEALQSAATRTTNWVFNSTFKGANLYGAAFNLRLFDTDSGWVHNPLYTRRVIYDTIDYLDDGILNGTVTVDPNTPLHAYLTRPNF